MRKRTRNFNLSADVVHFPIFSIPSSKLLYQKNRIIFVIRLLVLIWISIHNKKWIRDLLIKRSLKHTNRISTIDNAIAKLILFYVWFLYVTVIVCKYVVCDIIFFFKFTFASVFGYRYLGNDSHKLISNGVFYKIRYVWIACKIFNLPYKPDLYLM